MGKTIYISNEAYEIVEQYAQLNNLPISLSASALILDKSSIAKDMVEPKCLFGYYRVLKGKLDNTCYPRKEDPQLLQDRDRLVKLYCSKCDMREKALIRYKAKIKKIAQSPQKEQIIQLPFMCHSCYSVIHSIDKPSKCLKCGSTNIFLMKEE